MRAIAAAVEPPARAPRPRRAHARVLIGLAAAAATTVVVGLSWRSPGRAPADPHAGELALRGQRALGRGDPERAAAWLAAAIAGGDDSIGTRYLLARARDTLEGAPPWDDDAAPAAVRAALARAGDPARHAGRTVVLRGDEAVVQDARGADLARLPSAHDHTVLGAAWSPSGALIAVLDGSASIRLWDAASYRHLGTLHLGQRALAMRFESDQALWTPGPGGTQTRWRISIDRRSRSAIAAWARGLRWHLERDRLVQR